MYVLIQRSMTDYWIGLRRAPRPKGTSETRYSSIKRMRPRLRCEVVYGRDTFKLLLVRFVASTFQFSVALPSLSTSIALDLRIDRIEIGWYCPLFHPNIS